MAKKMHTTNPVGATCYIYTLHASNDRERRPRYVGFTINPKDRERKHNTGLETGRKKEWILGLRSIGEKVVLKIVHVFQADSIVDRKNVEMAWIESYQRNFPNLLNDLSGGQGLGKWSEGLRKKHSVIMKRRFSVKLERDKIGERSRRHWAQPEAREKQSIAQKQRWSDLEVRKKQGEAQKRRWANPKARKKMIKAMNASRENPVIRQKFLASMANPLTRKKMSNSMKKVFSNPVRRQRAVENAKQSWKNPAFRLKRRMTFARKNLLREILKKK